MADTYGSPGLFYGGLGTYGDWADTPAETTITGGTSGPLHHGLPTARTLRRNDDDEALLVLALI
jgi:hypothetical protein